MLYRIAMLPNSIRAALLIALLSIPALPAADFPKAEIRNDRIVAKIYLPDAEHGYYRGTRFDWSGVIYSLTYRGHEYFGEWRDSDDPYLHDHITGPVEEFRTNGKGLGYDEAPVGDRFIRIGVGVCEKPDEEDYRWTHTYKVVDPGERTTERGPNWIEFTQTVDAGNGYAYRYSKRLTLTPGTPELVIAHRLENTGRKTIESDAYNHNFFVMDSQPTGPGFVVRFPFELSASRDLKGIAVIKGKELVYIEEVPEKGFIASLLHGFGDTAADNQFTIENRNSKMGVKASTDRPMNRLNYWSPRTTLCPEPYIEMNIEPGADFRWKARYEFYTTE